MAAGYTPEQIAALRSRIVGGPGVSNFDKKASDVSASFSRLATNPVVQGMGTIGNPAAPFVHEAANQAALNHAGSPAGLSRATQAALNDQVSSPGGTILRPMENQLADVTPAEPLSTTGRPKTLGGGGGAGSGLGSLREAWLAARRKGMSDFDTDKELAGELGVEKAGKIEAVAGLQMIDAAQKQRDAEIQREQDENAAAKHQSFLNKNAEMADDIGKLQVDPKRLVHSMGTADKIGHVLGSALGGMSAGWNGGGPNEFLQRFDKQVAQDIDAQITAIDNKKASLTQRNNVFGQMLQQTGDRRLAAIQTRNLMYEAAKQKLGAQADELGIPEVRTNAQQNISAIQHQQDAMNTQFTGEAYQTAQQQAAAAAAAQRAAEKAAWDRQKEVFEMGLKKDQLDIERMKAGKEGGKEDNQAIAETTKRLGDDDIIKNKALIESLGRKVGSDGDIVGQTIGAKVRGALVGKRLGLSDEERIGQQEYDQLFLAYKNKVTGSGGSDAEAATIKGAFEGAGSMAEKRNVIEMAKADLKRREGLAFSNLDDSQKATLLKRLGREGQTAMPGSVSVKSGNVSDERAKRFKQKLKGY